MIITHASAEKIEKVVVSYGTQKGCLFFAAEGNTYNLAGACKYQYSLDVNNTIETHRFFYEHESNDSVVRSVMREMMIELNLDERDFDLAESLLDDSANIFDYFSEEEAGEANWMIQQYQGILADRLGYDAAEAEDEQGTVYIAYCVDRDMQELACN